MRMLYLAAQKQAQNRTLHQNKTDKTHTDLTCFSQMQHNNIAKN